MKFYVYHRYSDKLFSIVGHNTTDRVYNINSQTDEAVITCKYKSKDIEFIFTKNTRDESGYHIIIVDIARRYEKHFTFTQEIADSHDKYGQPSCFQHEFPYFLNNLNFNKKWVLLYSMGENLFINSKPSDYRNLNSLASKVEFFSDNALTHKSNPILNKSNFKNCLSNDVFIWNFLAKIRWSYEFKNIYDNLNPPFKIGFSTRKPKLFRLELMTELNNLNNNDVFLNQTDALFNIQDWNISVNDTDIVLNYKEEISKLKNVNINIVSNDIDNDFSNLTLIENDANSMEFDYLFRVMSKAGIQILDETHSYCDNESIPMNLTEKTYLFLFANIPFIPTNIYPLDVIECLISDVKYPYYDDIVKISGNPVKIAKYITHVTKNYDEYRLKLKEWVSHINSVLINEVENNNSMIDKLLKNNQ